MWDDLKLEVQIELYVYEERALRNKRKNNGSSSTKIMVPKYGNNKNHITFLNQKKCFSKQINLISNKKFNKIKRQFLK